jgi:hypothetical protein
VAFRQVDPRGWRRLPLASLAVFVLVVGVASEWGHGPSWDEAVYLSQVTPGIPAARFVASRARGIQLIAAPPAAITSNMAAIRVWMFFATLLAIAIALRAWRRVLSTRALLMAQILLLTCWLVPFYATKVMPNLWAGLAGLAAVALFERSVRGSEREAVWLAITLALMALLRPTDAAVLGAVLIVWLIANRPQKLARNLFAVAGGALVGALPWVIEMSVRFGGLHGAISSALPVSHVGAGGVSERLRQYLSLIDGPTLGPVHSPDVPFAGAVLFVAAIVLTALGVSHRGQQRSAVRLACVAGTTLSVFYILGVGGIAPRFLLPGIALLTIPAGEGAALLWTRARAVPRVLLAASLGFAVAWNVAVFRNQEETATRSAAVNEHVAELAAAGGLPDGCLVFSQFSFPQLDSLTRCEAHPLGASIPAALVNSRCIVVVSASGERSPDEGFVPLGVVAGWAVFSSNECQHQ